ncbi:MAG: septum formation inhibitor Maf [Clostridia bacterium]|nr:septum formation inhibitor Maf [Clostridia bacterium]
MDIVLASGSPRRAELLRQINLPFSIMVSDIDENNVEMVEPKEWVQLLASAKARDIAARLGKGLVIGADTVVVLDNKVLGKPRDTKEAIEMLEFLSGRTHQVMTGIALVDAEKGKKLTDVEITQVKFRELSKKEIEAYVASGEPMDKAGAYGIQGLGAVLVEGISGCYFNVVGLPLNRLVQCLKNFGVEIF